MMSCMVLEIHIHFFKRPWLTIVRFWNGKKFGFRMVKNKMAALAIRKPNFEAFGFRMYSVFECSEFEPPLYYPK